ncbi:hypothetical protein C0J52_02492 [Blattella germanica]|nr:hypothetical protein C0J52_02492 [Blattella germanica]
MRILKGCNSREHCRPIFEEFGVLTLPSFVLACLNFVRVRVLSVAHSSGHHSRFTRRSNDLVPPQFRLHKSVDSHLCVGIKLFNKLPSNIKQIENINKYKSRIKNILRIKNIHRNHNYYTIQEYLEICNL